jgi:hypothetical protein
MAPKEHLIGKLEQVAKTLLPYEIQGFVNQRMPWPPAVLNVDFPECRIQFLSPVSIPEFWQCLQLVLRHDPAHRSFSSTFVCMSERSFVFMSKRIS